MPKAEWISDGRPFNTQGASWISDGDTIYSSSFMDKLEFDARAKKIRLSPSVKARVYKKRRTYTTSSTQTAVSNTDTVPLKHPSESESLEEQPLTRPVPPDPIPAMGCAPRASQTPPGSQRGTPPNNQPVSPSETQQRISLETQHETLSKNQHTIPSVSQRSTPLETQRNPFLENQHGKSSETGQATPPESQRGQPYSVIQIDDDEERTVPTETVLPAFATTAEFAIGYTGTHTLHLEAQHRKFRFSNKSPHGDICIVCGQKKDKYIDRFACCSLKFCPDCISYEDGNSLLEVDRFCPVCFKRGWNHIRPYFGMESPVWKLLPVDYKKKYMESSHKVVEKMVRLLPEWCEWQQLLDDGTVNSDRLLLHTLQPYSISEHGKQQLSAFASNLTSRSCTEGPPERTDSTEGETSSQEPDLQWFVTRPILPLERFEKTMEHHQTYINMNQSLAADSKWTAYQAGLMQELIRKHRILQQSSSLNKDEGADPKPGDVSKTTCPWCNAGKGDVAQILRWDRTVELAINKAAQLRAKLEVRDTEVAVLKKELDPLKNELSILQKVCTQDHIPDLAAFGMELCRARGIARGNIRGVETRLQGDYLSKLPVQRLLNNPIFDRGWVQPSKKRKHAEDGTGWIVEDVTVKLEVDE